MTQLGFLRAHQRDLADVADISLRTARSIDDGSVMDVWDGITAVLGAVDRPLLPYLDVEAVLVRRMVFVSMPNRW